MPKAKKPPQRLSEADFTARLERRYQPPEWAFFAQVSNGTGASSRRHADGIAMGLWPSRGLELHGFEIKSYRGDWLRELKAPEKADLIAKRCHRWWIVANADVVKPGELPPTWGLLEPHGKVLRQVVAAEQREPEPLGWRFFAAMLRRCHEGYEQTRGGLIRKADIKDKLAEAEELGRTSERGRVKWQLEDFERLKESVADFEKASGVELNSYHAGDIGEAVKLVMASGVDRIALALRAKREQLKRLMTALDDTLEKLERSDANQTDHLP